MECEVKSNFIIYYFIALIRKKRLLKLTEFISETYSESIPSVEKCIDFDYSKVMILI